jgi:hypothetical protein
MLPPDARMSYNVTSTYARTHQRGIASSLSPQQQPNGAYSYATRVCVTQIRALTWLMSSATSIAYAQSYSVTMSNVTIASTRARRTSMSMRLSSKCTIARVSIAVTRCGRTLPSARTCYHNVRQLTRQHTYTRARAHARTHCDEE